MNRRTCGLVSRHLFVAIVAWTLASTNLSAASWQGIEPFKSRRDQVLKILGNPISENSDGALRFSVAGGTVTVSFASERFVTSKKLRPELAGTVLEIVLQHEHSSDTPESMKLVQNRDFVHEDLQSLSVFRSNRTGVVYTFLEGKLRTTRFTASEAELGKARR